MEIYNEDINDLLVPEHRKLQIHESIEVNNSSFYVILITNHL
jgi:centromeric protein E